MDVPTHWSPSGGRCTVVSINEEPPPALCMEHIARRPGDQEKSGAARSRQENKEPPGGLRRLRRLRRIRRGVPVNSKNVSGMYIASLSDISKQEGECDMASRQRLFGEAGGKQVRSSPTRRPAHFCDLGAHALPLCQSPTLRRPLLSVLRPSTPISSTRVAFAPLGPPWCSPTERCRSPSMPVTRRRVRVAGG